MDDNIFTIEQSKWELHHAEQNINYAEPSFIDAAIYDYTAKMAKLSALLQSAKAEMP